MKTKEEIITGIVKEWQSDDRYDTLEYLTQLFEDAYEAGFESLRSKVEEGVKKEIDKQARLAASEVLGIEPDKILADDTIMFGFKKGIESVLTTIKDIKE